MRTAYLPIHPYLERQLPVDDLHSLHVEECGNPDGVPVLFVHGRYDMVCPIDQAFALQQVWSKARLEIIRDAGHSSSEPGILDALVRATNEFRAILGHSA